MAFCAMRTSVAPGSGTQRSSTCSTSGPPASCMLHGLRLDRQPGPRAVPLAVHRREDAGELPLAGVDRLDEARSPTGAAGLEGSMVVSVFMGRRGRSDACSVGFWEALAAARARGRAARSRERASHMTTSLRRRFRAAEERGREACRFRALPPVPLFVGHQRMIAHGPAAPKILDPDFEYVGVGGELPVQPFELGHQRLPSGHPTARADDLEPRAHHAGEPGEGLGRARHRTGQPVAQEGVKLPHLLLAALLHPRVSGLSKFAILRRRWGSVGQRISRGNGLARPTRGAPAAGIDRAEKGGNHVDADQGRHGGDRRRALPRRCLLRGRQDSGDRDRPRRACGHGDGRCRRGAGHAWGHRPPHPYGNAVHGYRDRR